MKITPELIPHNEFHKGVWLLPVKRPGWYYFLRKPNRNIVTNPSFLDSVDEPLKELVSFLHERGIKTTPSCSGHHMSERNLEKIYDELVEDLCDIRDAGLELIDVETGKRYVLQTQKLFASME